MSDPVPRGATGAACGTSLAGAALPPSAEDTMHPHRATDLDAVLFDLDGTLIDSIRLILDSYHHTLAAHAKPAQSDAQLLAHVGTPLVTHLGQYAANELELAAMVATYRAWNRAHHDGAVRAFDGAVEAVRALAATGLALAVVTSKQREAAQRGLDLTGFGVPGAEGAPFRFLLGADDVAQHKPDPTPLLVACARLGVTPARAAYVGDSPHDLAAARAAGALAVAAGWGPFPRADLDAVGYDRWVRSPASLVEALAPASPRRA